jgi:hypothetical protein
VVWVGGLSAGALLLYALGARFLLVPMLLAVNTVYLPMPKVFRSWFGRFVASFVLTLSLVQVAAALQFLALPKSGFMTLAVIAALVNMLVVWCAPGVARESRPWLSRTDLLAFAVIALFLVPFAPIFSGHHSIERIAQIGSIQAGDSGNHYAYIAEATHLQHFNYGGSTYYPLGFHLSVGFVQHSFFDKPSSVSWGSNVVLFFAQYVVLAAILAYALYMLCVQWLGLLLKRVKGRSVYVLAAAALAPPLVSLYLIAFVPEGFLNYYYVCATIAIGFITLGELNGLFKGDDDAKLLTAPARAARWWLILALLFMFGAISSWPLLLPPLMVSAALFVVPTKWRSWSFWRSFLQVRMIALGLCVLLQFIPVYFQLKYGSVASNQGINAIGGLRTFHPFVLLAGLGLVAFVVLNKRIAETQRRLIYNVFMPLVGFIGLLTLYQYFTLGEARYYLIKSAMLLEMLMLVLGVVLLAGAYAQSGWRSVKYGVFVAAIPMIAMLLLISTAANPLKDDRDLFRSVSHQEKPMYFDQDVRTYTHLGLQGNIHNFNSTLLHYNPDQSKFYAHPQIPFWMNVMQYNGSPADVAGFRCDGQLYTNQAFGTFSVGDQEELHQLIFKCANLSRQRGQTFYIVTDKGSVPAIQREFGSVAKVVYK